MQSVRIKKKNKLIATFCKHTFFKAMKSNERKFTSNGIRVYKCCIKCGKIYKWRDIPKDMINFIDWSEVHLFRDDKKTILAMVRGQNE